MYRLENKQATLKCYPLRNTEPVQSIAQQVCDMVVSVRQTCCYIETFYTCEYLMFISRLFIPGVFDVYLYAGKFTLLIYFIYSSSVGISASSELGRI